MTLRGTDPSKATSEPQGEAGPGSPRPAERRVRAAGLCVPLPGLPPRLRDGASWAERQPRSGAKRSACAPPSSERRQRGLHREPGKRPPPSATLCLALTAAETARKENLCVPVCRPAARILYRGASARPLGAALPSRGSGPARRLQLEGFPARLTRRGFVRSRCAEGRHRP